MLRILLYEFLTGGGTWEDATQAAPSGSLLREGRAMIEALAADFARLEGCQPIVFHDARLPQLSAPSCEVVSISSHRQEQRCLVEIGNSADAVVVIAPETGGALLERIKLLEASGARLLCPDAEFVEVASDKHATVERLRQADIPAPLGAKVDSPDDVPEGFPFPAVLKPCDGAGSCDVRRVDSRTAILREAPFSRPMRIEQLSAGIAASVGVLCGPDEAVPLPPTRQLLAGDGSFAYLGGAGPLPDELATRAVRLAQRALQALPEACGYVGIDMCLGSDESEDMVIEVNPRLTTSYVGLRRMVDENLAELMYKIAQGEKGLSPLAARQARFSPE